MKIFAEIHIDVTRKIHWKYHPDTERVGVRHVLHNNGLEEWRSSNWVYYDLAGCVFFDTLGYYNRRGLLVTVEEKEE
ncbi:MAG: hypothetical protein WC423_24880 [Vulcanimicrobiota bacterium]